MDVTKDEDVLNAYTFVEQDLEIEGNYLWGLVNIAGILLLSHTDWGSLDSYRNVFDVNVIGTVRVTRIFLPLIRQSKGRIINMASVYGKFTPTFTGQYAMSKHALVSFSDALRRELNKWQIKVCTVYPGTFRTPFVSPDNLANILEKQWESTSESVKSLYGQQYFESIKHQFIVKFRAIGSIKFNLVIDAMVHALRSECPRVAYYINGSLRWDLTMFLNDYLPVEWFDQYLLYQK